MSSDFIEGLNSCFDSLEASLTEIMRHRVTANDHYVQVVKASLARSFEFARSAANVDIESSYMMVSTLRATCEDYIVLRYLFEQHHGVADRVIDLWLQKELFNSSVAQWQFFGQNKPSQVLFYKSDFESKLQDTQKQLLDTLGRKQMPSMYEMASLCGLESLYRYIYHAASTLVHFNPRILIRMGWGDLPDVSYSTKHFTRYYNHFLCFYSTYIFVSYYRWISENNILSLNEIETIDRLEHLISDEPHWPELVTFEEMNISNFMRIMLFDSPASSLP